MLICHHLHKGRLDRCLILTLAVFNCRNKKQNTGINIGNFAACLHDYMLSGGPKIKVAIDAARNCLLL